MQIRRSTTTVGSVYVVGTHDEFFRAVGDKLEKFGESVEDQDSLTSVDVTRVSHALAIDAEGRMHWSALLCMVAEFEDEDEDED